MRPNGGAALEALALEGDPRSFPFSLPLRKYQDCNFSFAGLKTAVRLVIDDQIRGNPSADNRQARVSSLLATLKIWQLNPRTWISGSDDGVEALDEDDLSSAFTVPSSHPP